jgi:hypothetical protein
MVAYIPAYERGNVLVGLARCFTQPYDPTTPPALPEDTVALAGTWSTPWVPVGATEEGMSFSASRDTQDIKIEEQPNPVDKRQTSASYTMALTLAEDTMHTMVLSYGGSITITAAGTTTPGIQQLNMSSDLSYFAFAFEGRAPSGFWRRVLVPIVVSVGEAETAYRRAEEKRMYKVSFESLVRPEDVIIREMTTVPTG